MSYLEIIEEVKRDRQKSRDSASGLGQPDEINEKDEISPHPIGAPPKHGATTHGWEMKAPVVGNPQAESPAFGNPAGSEPTKPTKAITNPEPVEKFSEASVENSYSTEDAAGSKSKQPEASGEMLRDCPFNLPKGVNLVGYEKKMPPVAITTFSVVNDPEKFIRHALAELDARLHSPIQIRAGDSVFFLLSKLADCGLGLRLEWEPGGNGPGNGEGQG